MKVEEAGRTIGELEKEGFTHIDCRCSACQGITQYPFRLICTNRPRLNLDRMTIAELAA
jgi:hypothetical protein